MCASSRIRAYMPKRLLPRARRVARASTIPSPRTTLPDNAFRPDNSSWPLWPSRDRSFIIDLELIVTPRRSYASPMHDLRVSDLVNSLVHSPRPLGCPLQLYATVGYDPPLLVSRQMLIELLAVLLGRYHLLYPPITPKAHLSHQSSDASLLNPQWIHYIYILCNYQFEKKFQVDEQSLINYGN